MIIEDFALVLRKRRPWEALDLGLVIARHWRRPALAAWLATYGVTGALLSLVALWDWRMAWFFIWWLKPLFDRVILYVYSHAVFGSTPSLGNTLRATRAFLSSGQLWADLTYRRLSPVRSFTLPVTQLEGQSGRARSARINVLGRSMDGCAGWLTVACANFVALLNLTFVAALFMLTPAGVGESGWLDGLQRGAHLGTVAAFGSIALMMVCETLIEPLYVASGFSLYLNRRSELEGWDLELAFRRLQRRSIPLGESVVLAALAPLASVLTLFALLCAFAAGPSPALADEPSAAPAPAAGPPPGPPSVAQDVHRVPFVPGLIREPNGPADHLDDAGLRVREVLRDPIFGHRIIVWHWESRATPHRPDDKPAPTWLGGLLRLFGRLAETLALFLGWGLRIVLGIVLLVAIVFVVRWNWGRIRPGVSYTPPTTLFGIDVRKEGLPSDVAGAARALLERGATAEALGLLYRACLVALVHRARIPFRDGDTEERCLARVAGRLAPANFVYFSHLIEAWRMTAYAHRPPERERIAELCASWSAHFGPEAPLESAPA